MVFASTSGQSRLYLNDGYGHFTDATTTHLPQGSLPTTGIGFADVDGDKDADLVLSTMNNLRTRLWLNDGTGRFKDATQGNMPADSDVSFGLRLDDADKDGDIDVLIANHPGQNRLYLNDGRGKFTDATSRLPRLNDKTYYVFFADVDNDGDNDILAANNGEQNRLYINDLANKRFVDETATRLPVDSLQSFGVRGADVDNDGDFDVFFANFRARNNLLLNDGTGKFTRSNRMPARTDQTYRIGAVDFDEDGDLDLLVVNYIGQNRLLINDGTGKFMDMTATRMFSVIDSTTGVAGADFDCDGDVDIAFGNWGQQNVIWYNHHRQTYAAAAPAIGQPWKIDLYSAPGYAIAPHVLVTFLGGPLRPKIPVQSFGSLGVHPLGLFLLPPVVIQRPGGKGTVTLGIPNDPGLRGIMLYTQALAFQPPNLPHFTNVHEDKIR